MTSKRRISLGWRSCRHGSRYHQFSSWHFENKNSGTLHQTKARVGQAKSLENATQQKHLFRGLSSNLIVSFPSAFCYFFGYDTTRNFLRKETSFGDTAVNILGGCGAEICANTVRTPFEIAKQRMQIGLHSKLSEAFTSLYKLRGVRGMA